MLKYYSFITQDAIGVFTDWDNVSSLITGAKGAQHKKFFTYEQAKSFIIDALSEADMVDFGLDKMPIYLNKKYVRKNSFIESKQSKPKRKATKYFAVTSSRKLGVYDNWFQANEIIKNTGNAKWLTFSSEGKAKTYLEKILPESDYEDFGLDRCEIFLNKTYVRKDTFLTKKNKASSIS